MTASIYTSAAGAGKTQFVIQRLLDLEHRAFWQERWVLLPNRLQSEAFRERLIAQAGRNALFNIRFFEFYELYDWLLDFAALPQRTLTGAASDHILRQVIDGLNQNGHLTYYQHIAHTPGFVQLVSRFIKELKQGVITLEAFQQAAASPKDHDLAQIYTAYQQFLLEQRLVDRDGAGWVALEALQANSALVQQVGLLAVDGFDNVTPLQARLLAALGEQVGELAFTLTYEAERQADASRPFQRTLDRLQRYGAWQVIKLDDSVALLPAAPLRHLTANLYSLTPQPLSAQDSLRWIEAPNPRSEVNAVLRHVKALLLGGVLPEQIMVVMRDPQQYMEAFRTTALHYQLPVVVRQAEALTQNPAVRAILNLLDLHQADFPRRALLDLLRNPYLIAPGIAPDDIALLERLSQELPIIGGRAHWRAGLERGFRSEREDDPLNEEAKAIAERLTQLKTTLPQLFDLLTPPPQASPSAYIHWLEGLLGTDPALNADPITGLESESPALAPSTPRQDFQFYAHLRAAQNEVSEGLMVRDLHALHSFRGAIQEVLAAYELLSIDQVEWQDFRSDLDIALAKRRISDPLVRSRLGRVLVTTVFEARGLPHDYVFIVGLAEGVFPQAQSEDALYNDPERITMEAQGLDIETAAERNRESGLFYEMCALAHRTLILSRPTLDDGGNEWMPSIFWRNVAELLTDAPLERLRLGAAPTLLEGPIATLAASERETAIGLSAALGQPLERIPAALWGVRRAFEAHPTWAQVEAGYHLESQREDRRTPFDHYSGILRDPMLIAEVARQLGPERIWSASQLNELGQCGFQFFAKRLLGLERYEEPDEGLTILELGTLNHEILEHTYEVFRREGWVIGPERQAQAVEVLRQVAQPLLARAPQTHGFQAPAFWKQQQMMLLKKLEQVVRLDFSDESPLAALASGQRMILRLEKPFGARGQPVLEIHGAGGVLRVRGYIDRLDVVEQAAGQVVLVVDYKSGSRTPSPSDLAEGRNFQMLLYLLAADQWLAPQGIGVLGGRFWSLQSNQASKAIYLAEETIEAAQHTLHYLVGRARAGQFPNMPRQDRALQCSPHCDFRHLCRVNRASHQKSLP
jgi:ATP-dependent helicase/nuclease subunit B